ncbi:putative DNA alkylation repair enzyme [Actinoplanes sp. SE50]|uniref:DNA alkylation repair protein n=1 Tax=unclassified Actinoplanes TaxID=2626549 RepID=UPI00023ED3BB|nr:MULTISPECIES: DNA alkylation repair protein [unclassified Actinoplanes]AEV82782.1 putative DNA alkylation repair enzyme [Actinoplanes sp. SE50/110]ATO81178.1 putative DNA alkylation repair enzyme [Actinoplanes sp. SE50]SLL98585.1 DNA alkylation repair enzyme [Actinoplanes sp. SE50/110]
MSLTEVVMARLTTAFEAARDPVRAPAMAAYMRDQFRFLGLSATARRAAARAVLAGLPRPDEAVLVDIARACWARDEREFQQFACDFLTAGLPATSPGSLALAEELITTKSWWDTVDPLATHFTGGLVRRHPELCRRMDDWSAADDLWLIRTAILHQLHYGAATDTDRLFDYCTRQAGHPDFFVRKAIGWALRHYARTDPQAVRAYLTAHAARLSPLSLREAAKHL